MERVTTEDDGKKKGARPPVRSGSVQNNYKLREKTPSNGHSFAANPHSPTSHPNSSGSSKIRSDAKQSTTLFLRNRAESNCLDLL
jgi:hypothetical protein